MNVSEFRKNISNELDKALQGLPVIIERGGVIFTVTPALPSPIKQMRGGK